MRVTGWLDGFIARHFVRHPRPDWPAQGSPAYHDLKKRWMDAFMSLDPRPRDSEAEAASLKVHGDAVAFVEDHPSVVADAITIARQAIVASSQADASKSTPEALSRDCEFCSGSGHATIYRIDYTGEPVEKRPDRTGELRPTPMVLAAHCVCPMGRWMRGKTPLDLQRRILDLEAVLSGNATGWTTDDPTLAGVSLPEGSPSGWRDLAAALVERTKA